MFNILCREKFTKELANMSNRDVRVTSQIMTGHAALNYHLSMINCTVEPICLLCEVEKETVSHLIEQYPMLGKLRAERFDTYY